MSVNIRETVHLKEDVCKPITREMVGNTPSQLLKQMFTVMVKIRLVEEKVANLVENNEIICPCHLSIGQEAVAAGVCAVLTPEDIVYSTHRNHAHYLAKGGSVKEMFAELYCRATGCSRGRGGSMHLVARDIGFPGASAIVGGTIPQAVGSALAFSLRKKEEVSVAFFGDGATDEGVFYESLNFAALRKLPVVFICENNFYSTHMHISERHANVEIYRKAEVFNLPAFRVDGYNVIEVFKSASGAVEKARNGDGPTLLEYITFRWRGHVGPNWDIDKGLRSQEEVDFWVNNCSLRSLQDYLLSERLITESEKTLIEKNIEDEIEEAVRFAKESPNPDGETVMDYVFA
jgi:pyruvate dehydrogenase E1 component alpha subunit